MVRRAADRAPRGLFLGGKMSIKELIATHQQPYVRVSGRLTRTEWQHMVELCKAAGVRTHDFVAAALREGIVELEKVVEAAVEGEG
jgi:hypothetical protein